MGLEKEIRALTEDRARITDLAAHLRSVADRLDPDAVLFRGKDGKVGDLRGRQPLGEVARTPWEWRPGTLLGVAPLTDFEVPLMGSARNPMTGAAQAMWWRYLADLIGCATAAGYTIDDEHRPNTLTFARADAIFTRHQMNAIPNMTVVHAPRVGDVIGVPIVSGSDRRFEKVSCTAVVAELRSLRDTGFRRLIRATNGSAPRAFSVAAANDDGQAQLVSRDVGHVMIGAMNCWQSLDRCRPIDLGDDGVHINANPLVPYHCDLELFQSFAWTAPCPDDYVPS